MDVDVRLLFTHVAWYSRLRVVALTMSFYLPLTLAAQNRPVKPGISKTHSGDPHLIMGKQLGAQGRWKEAEVELRTYGLDNPDSTEAVSLHAEALIKINQPFDAALELNDFLKQHPNALRVHELYAVLAAGPLRDVNLAIHELEICVKLAPRDFQAWKSLGDAYEDQVKTDQEIYAFQQAAKLRPNDAAVVASLAHAYGESGDTAKAAMEFKRAEMLDARPGQPEVGVATVEYLHGQYLAEHGSGPDAVVALTKALQFNPKSAEAYYWRARAYEKTGNRDHAIADAQKAIELSPGSKEAALLLITQYRKMGQMDKAQKYADIAQKIADAEQAQQTFGRALRDTLDQAEPLLRQGRFAEAIPLYESIVQKLPTFYEAYFDLGNCYAQSGRLADAETAFKKYLALQPVSADGHAALGMVLAEQGREVEAVPEFAQALKIDPTQVEVRKALANIHMQAGDFGAAVTVLKVAGDAHDAEAETMLANALDKSGDQTSALTAVNRALAINPADAGALQLQQELLAAGAARKH